MQTAKLILHTFRDGHIGTRLKSDAHVATCPSVSADQVVIVPIVKNEADREPVMAAVAGLESALKAAGVRAKVDAGTEKSPGWKFNFWEMKVTI